MVNYLVAGPFDGQYIECPIGLQEITFPHPKHKMTSCMLTEKQTLSSWTPNLTVVIYRKVPKCNVYRFDRETQL